MPEPAGLDVRPTPLQSPRTDVPEEMLPALVQEQLTLLHELDLQVKQAISAASEAEQSAKAAREVSAARGLFTDRKRMAIEELQSAGLKLAGAVQSSAQAQKVSFEFHTRMAEVSKYLFGLGVSNIANNRTVVRELEKRLAGASEEELSELARQEMLLVVRQLKDQEDLLRKHERMAEMLKAQDARIRHLMDRTDALERQLEDQYRQQADCLARLDRADTLARERDQALSAIGEQVAAQELHAGALAAGLSSVEASVAQLSARMRASLRRLAGAGAFVAGLLACANYLVR